MPVRRRIFNLFVGASTLLLTAALVLWIGSWLVPGITLLWDRGPSWAPEARRTQWGMQSTRGRLIVGRLEYSSKHDPHWRLGVFTGDLREEIWYRRTNEPLDWLAPQGPLEFLGFEWRHTVSGVFSAMLVTNQMDDIVFVAVPYWFLVLLGAIAPALKWRAAARIRRMRRLGLCLNCGYDLRGSPQRCPECGREVAA